MAALRLATVVALCALMAAPSLAENLPDVSARPAWTPSERNDDPLNAYTLYTRELPGSDFPAHRLEAILDAPPAVVAEAMVKNIADVDVHQKNIEKTIVRNEGDLTVLYTYIDLPLVRDRDVTTRTELSHDPETNVYRVNWHVTDEGPPPKDGVVRLEKSNGSWVFAPLGDGRTHAVCEIHTEIGGFIPAWLVNAGMADSIVFAVSSLRERLRKAR
jgi:hypothetical protein